MKESSRWWKHSLSDLETAEYNLKGGMLNAAAFYAQQAAEKALKAVQIEKLGRYSRGRTTSSTLPRAWRLRMMSSGCAKSYRPSTR